MKAPANSYRSVPPLTTLRTFEVVARKGSFTLAAQDLSITQSAVSHQIRALETFLGTPVFHRLNPGIELTGEGQTLLEGVRSGLDLMLCACDRVRRRHQAGVLTIAAPAAFASWWLVPRLGRFAALHPDIEIRLATLDYRRPDFARDGVDAAIVLRPAEGALDKNELRLFREKRFPVCSPGLRDGDTPLRSARDLHRYTLIEEDPESGSAGNWEEWLERLGVADAPAPARLRFSHYGVALSAAIDGLGVALARSPMIDAELHSGRLVPAFTDAPAVLASHVYSLTWPDGAAHDQRLLAFRHFVLDEACGCELAAGPCGAPESEQQAVDWSSERAARRRAAVRER
ncbi:LysR family transcriptional regulator [Alcanivorax balearicus MACL04]|uniref:LysR family transcriptional regulator n=2 Tax=Alloalcanivorax balearicus TaxID=413232 RepID=A0ABT2QWZ4_9GAMM|nr:LysR family transcriptional regulator [Alloalcanivorax balearicus MACL04]